jgi:hypothetical protein
MEERDQAVLSETTHQIDVTEKAEWEKSTQQWTQGECCSTVKLNIALKNRQAS